MVSRPDQHKTTQFDPFESRPCRQVRNALSKSLMDSIHQKEISRLQDAAHQLLQDHGEPILSRYIEDRITRYQAVMARILLSPGITVQDTHAIAILLWNQGLFFEVHEWIESKWLQSRGVEKQLLQALIRAAGAYVHLEAGNLERAGRLAGKALPPLVQHRALVPGYFHVGRLIASLEPLNPVPPKLGPIPQGSE